MSHVHTHTHMKRDPNPDPDPGPKAAPKPCAPLVSVVAILWRTARSNLLLLQ